MAQPARVVGRVLDEETREAIEAVVVRLVGQEKEFSQVTDGWGAFRFSRVPPGTYRLMLEHLAYGTHSDSVEFASGQLINLQVQLAMRPIQLKPLVVTVQRQLISPRLWGYYERADRGLGDFITREDIERRQPLRISHMIGELPGVSLIRVSGLRSMIVLSRYKRFGPAGRGPCWPVVYLDGRRIRLNRYETIDDLAIPEDVEGVEVYKGLASLPGEFAGYEARCGAVAVWTRSAPIADVEDSARASQSIWKKVAVGVGVMVLVLVML